MNSRLITLAIAAMLTAACGGDSTPTPTAPAPAPTSPAVAPASAVPTAKPEAQNSGSPTMGTIDDVRGPGPGEPADVAAQIANSSPCLLKIYPRFAVENGMAFGTAVPNGIFFGTIWRDRRCGGRDYGPRQFYFQLKEADGSNGNWFQIFSDNRFKHLSIRRGQGSSLPASHFYGGPYTFDEFVFLLDPNRPARFYTFRVHAYAWAHGRELTATSNFETVWFGRPHKPTDVTVVAGDEQVKVTFANRPPLRYQDAWVTAFQIDDMDNPNEDRRYYTIKYRKDSYEVPHMTNSGNYNPDGKVSINFKGLRNGNNIRIRLFGMKGTGLTQDTRYSDVVTVNATPRVSIPPHQPVVTYVEDGSGWMRLAWSHLGGNLEITEWQYRYKVASATRWGVWTEIPGSDGDTTEHTFRGLTNGTRYSFQVRAVNRVGLGTPSTTTSWRPRGGTTHPPPVTNTGSWAAGAPEQPNIVSAEAGHRSVTIAWTPQRGYEINEYQERYRKRGAPSWTEWADIPDSDGDTTEHTWNELENGVMYQFQIRAVNDDGPGIPSTTVSRRPKARAPEAPDITDVGGGDGWIRIEWHPPEGYAVTGWQARIRPDGVEWPRWTPIPVSESTEHTFRGLTNEIRYEIQIRGVNTAGPGTWSAPVRWRPRPPR